MSQPIRIVATCGEGSPRRHRGTERIVSCRIFLRASVSPWLILMGLLMLARLAGAAEPVDLNKRAEELKKLRFGMFICWSFSTFSEKEWTPGIKDVAFFNPTGCDTDQWAQTAKEAGMGYILFLTKHHDGFCLWDTKTTDRKVTKSPLGRDVLAELRKSCDKHGIKLALYFSEGDWNWPGATDGKGGAGGGGSLPEMKKAQLKELLSDYGPVEYIWFDHAIGDGGLSHKDTVDFCHQVQLGTLIGFNHGTAAGEVRLGEMGHPSALSDPRGSGFNAEHTKGYTGYLLAEFTYPILPAHQGGAMWFYSLPKHDNLCHPAEKIYRDYRGAVKFDNIFSLDVGPDKAGRIRNIDVETLRKVGELIRAGATLPAPPVSLAAGKPAKASSVWDAKYGPEKAFDGDDSTRWGAMPNSRAGWIEVDLGQETPIGRAMIREISFPRTREYAIEYKDGEAWKELAKGTKIDSEKIIEFAPVKARYVRLSILKAIEVPTIDESEVYAPVSR